MWWYHLYQCLKQATIMPYPLPKIIAHRGASAYAPENTLASFKKAYELGARWLEFDVVLTRDQVPIIFHDATTTRTTDTPDLLISELTLSEVKKLDAGRWFSPEFAGEAIPTLEEVLLFMLKHNMQANIEIKSAPHQEAKTSVLALEVLKTYWSHAPFPLISSFSETSLQAARDTDPHIPLAFIQDTWEEKTASILESLSCVCINLNYQHLSGSELIKSIKNRGYSVLCYTINDAKTAKNLFQWGVDGIFTNHPDLLSAH